MLKNKKICVGDIYHYASSMFSYYFIITNIHNKRSVEILNMTNKNKYEWLKSWITHPPMSPNKITDYYYTITKIA